MWKETPDGIILPVKASPKSSKMKLSDGKTTNSKSVLLPILDKNNANEELIAFLANTLHISKSQIKLISGSTSRHKRLRLIGIKQDRLLFLENQQIINFITIYLKFQLNFFHIFFCTFYSFLCYFLRSLHNFNMKNSMISHLQ